MGTIEFIRFLIHEDLYACLAWCFRHNVWLVLEYQLVSDDVSLLDTSTPMYTAPTFTTEALRVVTYVYLFKWVL